MKGLKLRPLPAETPRMDQFRKVAFFLLAMLFGISAVEMLIVNWYPMTFMTLLGVGIRAGASWWCYRMMEPRYKKRRYRNE